MGSLFQRVGGMLACLCVYVWGSTAYAAEQAHPDFDHHHSLFAVVLGSHVDQYGRVDYAAIKKSPDDLRRYLRDLALVDAATYRRWSRDEQLAFLLNLYNAQTIDLVIRHYPLGSIKDIGTLLRGPWGQPAVNMFGFITTLDSLEHKFIRGNFTDPRINFALVCAATSAPPLRQEPFTAWNLEEQLEDQARRFIFDTKRVQYDPAGRVIAIPLLFKWAQGDFELSPSGSVENYVLNYLASGSIDRAESGKIQVRFLDYDWSLNDQISDDPL